MDSNTIREIVSSLGNKTKNNFEKVYCVEQGWLEDFKKEIVNRPVDNTSLLIPGTDTFNPRMILF